MTKWQKTAKKVTAITARTTIPTTSTVVLPEEGVPEGFELAEGEVELREEKVELREEKVELREVEVELTEGKAELREEEVELKEEEVELTEGKAELAEAEIKLLGYVAAGYVGYEELTPSSTTGVVLVGTV